MGPGRRIAVTGSGTSDLAAAWAPADPVRGAIDRGTLIAGTRGVGVPMRWLKRRATG
ncbi:MAG TPA: hypothetical protein VLI72_14285 [Methylibium sp.]|nr:hypothetical protein [Methylibium sp.]